MLQRLLLCAALVASLPLPVLAQQAADAIAPEDRTRTDVRGPAYLDGLPERVLDAILRKDAGESVRAEDWMIAVANPHAAEAGAKVLEAGGTAADAMIAAQAVLGLVEPQSSGIGGGAFLLYFDAGAGELTSLDGRETAPADITPTLFQDEEGEPLKFFEAVVGGRSVGVPGVPALMEEAHRRWGRANWQSLFDPAIELAEGGFTISPRLAELVAEDTDRLNRFAATGDYFAPSGDAIAAGDRRTNPAYAETLRMIAREGADAFYRGPIAERIVETVRSAEGNPGTLTTADFEAYRVVERRPVCIDYRQYAVCGMGPPSSGGLSVGGTLGLLRNTDLPTLGPDSAESWRLFGEASRLAFADRGRYIADSDFVPVPIEGLLADDYLAERAGLLDSGDALPEVTPGEPAFDHALLWADDASIELPSTTHISIVDRYGNALSMTSSIENGFGSRLMVSGFLLNNQLTDFSFETHEDGVPIANRPVPRKRPRSSMAPTIVMRDGKPAFVLGSPGGSRIIPYVAQAILALIDWDMEPQAAAGMAHRTNRFGTYDLEEGEDLGTLADALTGFGYEVETVPLNSGLHIIAIDGTLRGGADPRREGIALGD